MAEIIALRFIELELLPFVKTNVLFVIWQLLLPVHFTLLLQNKTKKWLWLARILSYPFLLVVGFELWAMGKS